MFLKNTYQFKTEQKEREKWRHVRYTTLKKLHYKVFKVQLSCCDALCNIWPSCLARFAQVCPWFVLGKNTKPHNYSSFPRINLAPWCFQFYSDPKNPPKPHLKHHSQLQVIAEGVQSEFPPQASQSTPSQQWPWSALRWGHQRLKLTLQALTLAHEPALRGFYLKRLWKVSPVYMAQASGTITHYWSFQDPTDFWTSAQPPEGRGAAEWV